MCTGGGWGTLGHQCQVAAKLTMLSPSQNRWNNGIHRGSGIHGRKVPLKRRDATFLVLRPNKRGIPDTITCMVLT